jgi:hypothetical protein
MIYPNHAKAGEFFWTLGTLDSGQIVEIHAHAIGNSRLAIVADGCVPADKDAIKFTGYSFDKQPIKYTVIHGINGYKELIELPQGVEAANYYRRQAELALVKSNDNIDCIYALLMYEYHMDGAERWEIETIVRATS